LQTWTPVSRTALGVARIRARESDREDRLFDDPYAEAFLAVAEPVDPVPSTVDPVYRRLAFHVVIRTRFYDDYLLDATAAGCSQVVLLAAGLDTRAHRLTWPPGVRLFELDLPPLLAFKAEVLERQTTRPQCERVPVPTDLRDDWGEALISAGFDPRRATAWLAEGLLVYLTAEETLALLTEVSRLSAPGSQLATEGGRGAVSPAREVGRLTALWKGGLGRNPASWLDDHGWRCNTPDLTSVATALGRPPAAPSDSGFVIADRDG